MIAKHTPGPWMVEPINSGETYQITTTERTAFAVIAETPVDGTGRDEANAQLIAAAPRMLDALQLFLHAVRGHGWDESVGPEGEAVAATRAAIRAATGGEND